MRVDKWRLTEMAGTMDVSVRYRADVALAGGFPLRHHGQHVWCVWCIYERQQYSPPHTHTVNELHYIVSILVDYVFPFCNCWPWLKIPKMKGAVVKQHNTDVWSTVALTLDHWKMKDLISYCVRLVGELGEGRVAWPRWSLSPESLSKGHRTLFPIELHILFFFGVCTTNRK